VREQEEATDREADRPPASRSPLVQVEQHVGVRLTCPPLSVHSCACFVVWHVVPITQSVLVAQVVSVLPSQWNSASQVPYSVFVQVAKPRSCLPQTERAAQRCSLPLQLVGSPWSVRSLMMCAAQLT